MDRVINCPSHWLPWQHHQRKYYNPHCAEEETESQRSEATFPRSLTRLLSHSLFFTISVQKRKQTEVIRTQAAWGSLCSFLLNVPGLCREALILIFKTIIVNDNNLALTLIYESMILAVVITKLNQTTRQNQNSEGWHFNIKRSTTLKNRNHKNRTAESPQGQVFLEPGDRRKFQYLKGQQIAKSDYLWR